MSLQYDPTYILHITYLQKCHSLSKIPLVLHHHHSLPPPLPPRLVGSAQRTTPTTPPDQPSPGPIDSLPQHHEPVYYFFYGTLANPDILKGVLDLKTEPILRSAKIHSYELSTWDQYRTLVDSNPNSVVTGSAYMVESAEHEHKLAYYETNAYTVASCRVLFTDRGYKESVLGRTFKYAGDAQALKEGRFDRTLWEKRMGRRLPEKWQSGEGGDMEEVEVAH